MTIPNAYGETIILKGGYNNSVSGESISILGDSLFSANLRSAANRSGEETLSGNEYTYYEWDLSEDRKSVLRVSVLNVETTYKVPANSETNYAGHTTYSYNARWTLKYNGKEFLVMSGGVMGAIWGLVSAPVISISFFKDIDEIPYIESASGYKIPAFLTFTFLGYDDSEDSVGVYTSIWVGELSSKDAETYKNFMDGVETEDDYDPYNPDADGQSGTGGGEGDFDNSSDDIGIPDLPGLSAVDTGFVGIFKPSLSQVKALADYMWSDLFSIETFKKIFADPMDCILGFSIVPVSVPGTQTAEVKVGNISTGVSMTKASTQYVSVDCGSINMNEFWGSFLDYAPHTKISVYLPFIGFRTINTDEVMGATIRIVYHVDILTGALIAYITRNGSVMCTYEGACASNIPLSANDWTQTINGIVSLVSSGISAVATGGTGAIAKAAGEMALSGAQNISSLKPRIEHSGSISGAGGMLAVQTPYILAERPRQCLPKNQNVFSGYPSYITAEIGSQKGFTKISEINPTGISATEEEMEEIISILKGGVII